MKFREFLFAWLLSLLVGAPLCALAATVTLALRYGYDLEITRDVLNFYLMAMGGLVVWGGALLFIVTLLLVLPVVCFWHKRPVSKWLVAGTAFLGGALASMGKVSRWYWVTFPKYELWASDAYLRWTLIIAVLYFAGGALFGGMYGGWLVFFARRARKSMVDVEGLVAGNSEGGRFGRLVSGFIIGVAAVAMLFVVVKEGLHDHRALDDLTQRALKHQADVLEDAQILLNRGAGARNQHTRYFSSMGDPELEHLSLLGSVYCRTWSNTPGAVEIELAGADSRRGLYVVPEPTSATVAMLREKTYGNFGYVVKVNEHVFQYRSGRW